jgi:hypothetical protein
VIKLNYVLKTPMAWLEIVTTDHPLLKIDLAGLVKIIVKRNKDLLEITFLSSEKGEVAELIFPNFRHYRSMSRYQCEIVYHKFLDSRDRCWVVADGSISENISSSNGTFVDGVKLTEYEVKKLNNNHVIQFAGKEFPQIKFCNPSQEEDSESFPTLGHEREFNS